MTHNRPSRALTLWLSLCLLLVAAMVAVGGYTRLSGSGLSITSWKPIHGVIPPLNGAQWQEEFLAYQASPQYRKVNAGMTPEGFKAIFWPEYIHRLMGRLIGAAFLLPLVWFAWRGRISGRLLRRLAAIFVLGGLQGIVGWLMVKSGLVDHPAVSPLRLVLHLGLAFAIFGLLLWTLLEVVASGKWQVASKKDKDATDHWPLATYLLWFLLLCLQILMGALTAGHHAGMAYNTWPDMNGRFLPEEALAGDRIALIQFVHRKLAVIVAIGFVFWWRRCRVYVTRNALGNASAGITALLALQFALGVATLLQVTPLPLALAHQMTALALFAGAVVMLYRIRHA